ncbi:MAG: hypothetical protein U0166_05250 [Acidobacteriota bacterium]
MTDFRRLIEALVDGGVAFIIVGGAAAAAHGAARLTLDLDVVYARDLENLSRLAAALAPLSPYLRGAPPGLPFKLDAVTLKGGLNFTLTTAAGEVDLLGEITAGGRYADLLPHADKLVVFDRACLCLGLDRLIYVKRAVGRPKDLEAVAELEALREERRHRG